MNILLADDVEINRALVQAILEPFGHKISSVENGKMAVEACESASFDVVLMDVQMPEMDGLQATRAIREFERRTGRNKSVPIVAMTAFAGSEDRQICIDAGMDDYLTKPIKSDLLLQMLSRYCREPIASAEDESEMLIANTVPEVLSSEQEDLSSVFLQSELAERLGGHAEMIPRFIALFFKGVLPEIEALSVAVAAGDVELIRRHAHAIKGSAANIAAPGVSLLASEIEKSAKEGDLSEAPQRLVTLQVEYRKFTEVVVSLGLVLD